MFKKITFVLALITCAIVYSCSSPEPYYAGEETPIHSIPSSYAFYEPEWPEDEDGECPIPIEVLVDSVDYLTFSPQALKDPMIDSLVYVYNLITLFNAFDADALTYTRELAEPSHIKPGELDWIKEGELRNLFIQMDKTVCSINNSEDDEEYKQASSKIQEYIYSNFLDALYAKVDTTGLDKALDPTTYVKDIESLHKMILTDPAQADKTLEDRVLSEKYFIPQSYLAEELALSHYANNGLINGRMEEIAGLLEEIMNADIYTPNLTTIWRMWRVRNQFYYSPSNDGPIFNHYFNTYRNRIAKTYLQHYIKTKDSDALLNFLELAVVPNVVRGGSLIGNYSTVEDMELFWAPTRTKGGQDPS